MSLSSLQLDAFVELAKTLNFSKAAANLRLTQSALSQRIRNLEEELSVSLFIRETSGTRLTEIGHQFLRFCQTKNSLEVEFLSHLKGTKADQLGGILRIGGFSSIVRSVIMPALGKLVRTEPALGVECFVREMRQLPLLLKNGEAEFVVLDHVYEKSGIENCLLGYEENVLVDSPLNVSRREIYLDHDPDDLVTELFFRQQGGKIPYLKRSFMDDVYGIIEGVSLGWGKAVLPRHLIRGVKGIKVLRGFRPLRIPVVLHYYSQPFYSKLHHAVVETLLRDCRAYLN